MDAVPGKGRGHRSQAADPDEIIHFCGDEQYLQATPSRPSLRKSMQEWVQFSIGNYNAPSGPSVPEFGKRFPAEAAQFRVTPNQKIKSRTAEGALGNDHIRYR